MKQLLLAAVIVALEVALAFGLFFALRFAARSLRDIWRILTTEPSPRREDESEGVE